MTFMVIQKYVNLSRLMVVVAFSAIGLGLFSLDNNQITNIKPLQSLTNLSYLSLSGNLITPQICPMTKPESICTW